MMESLFAWTAPGSLYPPYFNISQDGDEIVVTLRTTPLFDAVDEVWMCGQTTTLRLPAKDATDLAALKASPPVGMTREAVNEAVAACLVKYARLLSPSYVELTDWITDAIISRLTAQAVSPHVGMTEEERSHYEKMKDWTRVTGINANKIAIRKLVAIITRLTAQAVSPASTEGWRDIDEAPMGENVLLLMEDGQQVGMNYVIEGFHSARAWRTEMHVTAEPIGWLPRNTLPTPPARGKDHE
jgi:hypothetical protein